MSNVLTYRVIVPAMKKAGAVHAEFSGIPHAVMRSCGALSVRSGALSTHWPMPTSVRSPRNHG